MKANCTHLLYLFSLLLLVSLAGCLGSTSSSPSVEVEIVADGNTRTVSVPSGSTVQTALESVGIELDADDTVNPPSFALISAGLRISVTRVEETIEVVTDEIPFEQQILPNEALPEGESRILQAGVMGMEELTYRIRQEEGEDPQRILIGRIVIEEPIPEIIMVGKRPSFVPVHFSGRIAYTSAGNAWLIDGETGNRTPLVLSGDLDGRIFQLSPDGRWLLFTRNSGEVDGPINTLWIVKTFPSLGEPIDLEAENIIHFSEWAPAGSGETDEYTIGYSTVEPRPSAPGWQANNDFQILVLDENGVILDQRSLVGANPGGQYGWWGTSYSWSPDGEKLAYARADSIGLLEIDTGRLTPLIELTPYQTFGDWAWLPYIRWSYDGATLFFIDHGDPLALESREASQVFNLSGRPIADSYQVPVAKRTGMFSQFAPSPPMASFDGGDAYRLAFLQAVFPLESEESHYKLVVMDRDGSNQRILFPPEGELGADPGMVVWSPDGSHLGMMYRGDVWIIDQESGLSQRITADGQTTAIDWTP